MYLLASLLSQFPSRSTAPAQEYVPVTFSLPLFALGTEYTDATVQKIVDKLLSVQPARRQPEAMH